MANRIVHQGFRIIPLLGILDEETDVLLPAQGAPTDVPATPGSLVAFQNTWPATFARIKEEYAASEAQRQAPSEIADEGSPDSS